MHMTNNVLSSPAVAVLCGLEDAGLDLAVVHGRLRVWPVERLTAEHEGLIQQHRDELITLVRMCDDGVQERLLAFKAQLREAPEGSLPNFVFTRGVTYARGVCFSCAAVLREPRNGRCWRCSLGWKLAAGLPITTSPPGDVSERPAPAEARGRGPPEGERDRTLSDGRGPPTP